MAYNVDALPENGIIEITGSPLSPFLRMEGSERHGEVVMLPFSQKTALSLRKFFTGEPVTMSLQTKTYLKLLAEKGEKELEKWTWSLNLHDLRNIPFPQNMKNLRNMWDLLHYIPLRYIDKSNPQKVAELTLNSWSVVVGTIKSIEYKRFIDATEVVVQDVDRSTVSAMFFRQAWLSKVHHQGDEVILYGNYSEYVNKKSGEVTPQISNAKLEKAGSTYDNGHKIAPVYSEKAGAKKIVIAKEVEKLLNTVAWIEDPVPDAILEKYALMPRNEAYRKLHFPETLEDSVAARRRIAFDDFVRLQVFLLNSKKKQTDERTGTAHTEHSWSDKFVAKLPFELTGAQKRVNLEIGEDMASEKPMLRLLHGEVGSGKAQPLYSKILTPSGFKPMLDMAIGDEVLTPDGKSTFVEGIFPQGIRSVYELTFKDGTKVRADGNHLWAVHTTGDKYKNKDHKIMTTIDIRDDLFLKNGYSKWYIDAPVIKDFGAKWNSVIDPYLLGALLGGGNINADSIKFTAGEDSVDTLPLLEAHLPNREHRENILLTELRRLNLMDKNPGSKFIPEELLHTDEASRLLLLQGLLDADGSVESGKTYSFSSVSRQLANDVAYLARSLGGVARVTLKKRRSGLSYAVYGNLPNGVTPFRMLRKKQKFDQMPNQIAHSKAIVEITYVGEESTQCIKLNDPKGLYITDDFTVTHNTEVSTSAILRALENKTQIAFLAPTSILAEQLYERFKKDVQRSGFDESRVRPALYHNGVKVSERKKILQQLLNGEVNVLIGTHSILSATVVFSKLGLIVIDEQHKFGSKNRRTLQENFTLTSKVTPDVLMMSATPIPRTMAQTIYGDMSLSVIDELPAERKPVFTYWEEDEEQVWKQTWEQVREGHQAYVIAALVEESESEKLENVENAISTQARLQNDVFPEFKVGLVHGKMKASEKAEILAAFYRNEINILVSTTVIEVGVNVPNATVMTILNANRFGIASLHQIRGRVGRGAHQSYCYLVGEATTPEAEERLNAMVVSNDGFWLAEKDLEIRGEGSLFKDAQHGDNEMIVGNLREHRKLLEVARRVAASAANSPRLQLEVKEIFGDNTISS